MNQFITSQDCTSCGTCISVCPKHILYFEDGFPTYRPGMAALCTNCGHCTTYCPEQGCLLGQTGVTTLARSLRYTQQTRAEMAHLMKNRRSARFFSRLPVDQQTLHKILAATAYYPSAQNIRPVRFVIINDRNKVKALSDKIVSWMETTGVTLPNVGDPELIKKQAEAYWKGDDIIFHKASGVIFMVVPRTAFWGTVDATIAATYFNLAAESFDVGCTFAGRAVRMMRYAPEILDMLGIKETEMAPIGLFFGRKTLPAVRIPARPPVPVTFL